MPEDLPKFADFDVMGRIQLFNKVCRMLLEHFDNDELGVDKAAAKYIIHIIADKKKLIYIPDEDDAVRKLIAAVYAKFFQYISSE